MAAAAGLMGGVGGCGYVYDLNWLSKNRGKNGRKENFRVSCVFTPSADPYKTLSIQPDASEYDVKKAFRKLALKYHPDVCKESNNGVHFHQINEAYNLVMSYLRGEATPEIDEGRYDSDAESSFEYDDEDLWEEWMGWEGAGIRDYSSHINPYI